MRRLTTRMRRKFNTNYFFRLLDQNKIFEMNEKKNKCQFIASVSSGYLVTKNPHSLILKPTPNVSIELAIKENKLGPDELSALLENILK